MGSLGLGKRRGTHARLAFIACVFGFAAISIGASPAATHSPSLRFEATLAGTTTWWTGWCCGTVIEFRGTGTVMGVGAVEFTGRRLSGCEFPPVSGSTRCFRTLDLSLVARNGDRLGIRGNDEWLNPIESPPQVTSWRVDQSNSTGRFADFAASGTYTFAADADQGVLIALTGVRQRG